MVCGRREYPANGRRDLQRLGRSLNKRFDRLPELCERNAGVAKQGKLKGKPDAIGIAPCRRDQAESRGAHGAPRRLATVGAPSLVPLYDGESTGRLSVKRTQAVRSDLSGNFQLLMASQFIEVPMKLMLRVKKPSRWPARVNKARLAFLST